VIIFSAKIINPLCFVFLPLSILFMKIKDQIPNLVTLLNLLCGSIAVFLAFSGELTLASYFIFLAVVLDFCDGFAARLLHAKSGIGAQLDSLADVISFGLAPSAIMYQLMLKSSGMPSWSIGSFPVTPFFALLLVAGGAYRLAKFNTDPGQSEEFKGLPIPSTGLFIASLPLIVNRFSQSEGWTLFFFNYYLLLSIVIFLSCLMVSNIPMISLKFKNLKWKGNAYRIILAGCSVLLLIFFQFAAMPMIIFLYIILSIIGSYRVSA
jgi:CDP-diacylglycerol--serine O-phosphatidyltransferase